MGKKKMNSVHNKKIVAFFGEFYTFTRLSKDTVSAREIRERCAEVFVFTSESTFMRMEIARYMRYKGCETFKKNGIIYWRGIILKG